MNRKVLVVEDSPVINKILTENIEKQLGLEVTSVFNLTDAKEAIMRHSRMFFVAILDLTLPDAPHGEVVEEVLALGIKPIILTANMSDDLHDKMMAKPIIDYAVKRNLSEMQYVLDLVERLHLNFERRILVVDDSASSRALLRSLLERHNFTVIEADEPLLALDIIQCNPPFDLIITDFNMPNMTGASFITKVREKYTRQDVAIIGISTIGDGKVSIQMLKAGANDFITRPFVNEEFYCRVNQNIDAISSFHKMEQLAFKDFLTQLYNRHYLFNHGKKKFTDAQKHQQGLAVAMMDIDYFKKINDSYSHQAGDEVLKFVAGEIQQIFAGEHIVARVGGEEFCVLCLDKSVGQSVSLFEKLRRLIMDTPILWQQHAINVSISIGVTFACDGELEAAISKADALLYQAKASGRNRVVNDG